MRPPGNSRDVLLTDLAKVIALRVTAQVVVELIDEDRGQHACVVSQRQAGWQIWNLPHHLQDLPQACKTDGSCMCKPPAGLCPHKHPLTQSCLNTSSFPSCLWQNMPHPEWRALRWGQETQVLHPTLAYLSNSPPTIGFSFHIYKIKNSWSQRTLPVLTVHGLMYNFQTLLYSPFLQASVYLSNGNNTISLIEFEDSMI